MKKKARPAKISAEKDAAAWRVPLTVEHIPDAGFHRTIEAPAEACDAVAALAGVRAVTGLSADVDVVRDGVQVHVTGRVRARVGQTCVVTLEPIETEVDEPIDVVFAPEAATGASAGESRERNPEEELPEPLVGGTVDLGAIATEFLILGIEPYPRKAGVEFAPPEVEDDVPHPFAALEALKKPSGGDSA